MDLVQPDTRLILFALIGSILLHALMIFALDFRIESSANNSTVLNIQLMPSSAEESGTLADQIQQLEDNPSAKDPDSSNSAEHLAPLLPSGEPEIPTVESMQDSHLEPEITTSNDQSIATQPQQLSNPEASEEAHTTVDQSPRLSVQDLVSAATSIAYEQSNEQNVRNITNDEATSTEEEYYLKAWHKKVQEIGQLNYPQEAVENNLYGKLRLYVAIKPDGSLKETRVIRSSGHDVLDEAAIHIVELAAPFSAFPKSMRESLDLLEIVRDWEFRKEALVPATVIDSEGN